MLFGKKDKKRPYNFHNDETLSDQTVETLPLGLRDVIPAVKLATTKLTKGNLATVVKSQIPNLPTNDPLSQTMTKGMVSMLWGSMMHPAVSYKGNAYQYRTPDGSNNNILYPNLGKAGTAYSKTIQPLTPAHGARPDPGDIFDLLMARDEAHESKTGISSLLLYMATIVIHDIFRTDDLDSNKSKTSSYLDLAPLYGSSEKELKRIRLMKNGLLKPDTFAEDRLTSQPPGVCIFIIMFNRYHNYVAQQILEINENGRFTLPAAIQATKDKLRAMTEEDELKWSAGQIVDDTTYQRMIEYYAAVQKQDEDIFQTARLITCGMYAQIAVHDYLRCLMRMHEKNTPWTLDPRMSYQEKDNHRGLQRGEGNMVSCEFNLLYRFHPPLSERDREWSEDAFSGLLKIPLPNCPQPYVFPDNADVTEDDIASGRKITESRLRAGDVPVPKFAAMLKELKSMVGNKADPDPKKATSDRDGPFWPPGLDSVGAERGHYRFERDPTTGLFDTAQLAAEMIRCIEDPILSFGARHIPKVFKQIEILGILQARKWEVAGLNEFRAYFGMERHKTFEDINSDPSIQNALRDLYEDPDQVELYPGVFCEGSGSNDDPDEPLPNDNGSALWRGIFSDAVTLVRSDRFYTVEWNVQSLTAWGLAEVTSNPKVNKGSLFHRLFQRAFPGYFAYNSIHMWQPFFTPMKNAILAQEQGYLDQLDLSGLEWVTKENYHKWDSGEKYGKDAMFKPGDNMRKLAQMDKNNVPAMMLRRKLDSDGKTWDRWRGGERARRAIDPHNIDSFVDIKDKILTGPTSADWKNPAILEVNDIPAGWLRDIMTNKWQPWEKVTRIIQTTLEKNGHSNDNDKFLAYFDGLAGSIRDREERPFQYIQGQAPGENGRKKQKDEKKFKVKQLDIVKDFSVPLVTRFISDFLGFWWHVKTNMNSRALERELNENQVYQHIQNCQNFEAYDADPAKTWERRQAFQTSIRKLKSLTEEGIRYSQSGLLGGLFDPYTRTYGDYDEHDKQKYVIELRRIGVEVVQALQRANYSSDQIAAIMLATALDAAHKVVLTFTEVVAFFIDPTLHPDGSNDQKTVRALFKDLQKAAFSNTPADNDTIKKYVLEAQRLTHKLKLVRVYKPTKKETPSNVSWKRKNENGKVISTPVVYGDTILVDLYAANHDKNVFPRPEKFDIKRKTTYLIYGNEVDSGHIKNSPTFSKHLSLIALTGMLKHVATLKNLRVAHDKLGRLKKVMTPNGQERYCSTQWNVLLPSPVTWNLRYDNVGEGVYEGRDNANQGHGMNQTWQFGTDLERDSSMIPSADKTTTWSSKTSTRTSESYKDSSLTTRVNVTEIYGQ